MVNKLLTPEELDACWPTESELEEYMKTPDDGLAAIIRKNNPEQFILISKIILYGNNVAKAQYNKGNNNFFKLVKLLENNIEEDSYTGYKTFIVPKDEWIKMVNS